VFRTVMPGWDNTPRTDRRARIFHFGNPRSYREWLQAACDDVLEHQPPEKRLVFINAWNEWAEGAHLEPDQKYGYAYLNATAAALRKSSGDRSAPVRGRPTISVVVPARDSEAHVSEALSSVLRQTLSDVEIIVVDRGSTDRTLDVVRAIAADNPQARFEEIRLERDATYAGSINRGVDAARSDFVATSSRS
jgi:hypothetical protein